MTRLVGLFAAILALFLTAAAWAQEGGDLDYSAFESLAQRAERLVEQNLGSEQVLTSIRTDLAEWRTDLLAAQEANDTRIATLQAQLDALGPLPEEGTEATEISLRREELRDQLASAQVPQVNATVAFNRADGLIAEIDDVIRARETAALLEHGPIPLNPMYWRGTLSDLTSVATILEREVSLSLATEDGLARLRDVAPRTVILLIVGAFLLLRGTRMANRVTDLVQRRRWQRGRASLSFVVSLGQIALPVIGAVLILLAIIASGLLGTTGTALMEALAGFLATSFVALWLGARLFPPDPAEPAAFDMPGQYRAPARRNGVAIGVVTGVGVILTALVSLPTIGPASRAVILFPYIVAHALFFWRLATILRRAALTPSEDETASGAFSRSILWFIAVALSAVSIGGPLLAAAGYSNAAEALMVPAALSLGVVGVIIALQVPIRDTYALVSNTSPEDARDALIPVLLKFALLLAAMPILALIWGMRPTEIGEIYARFNEGFALGDGRVTPGDGLRVVLAFAFVMLLTRLLQGALRSTVLPRTRLDPGARNAVVSGLGYVGVGIAFLIAINAGGIDLTALAFIVSALSVGIGFGLQNVVQNFISGIILLVERPIGEGDWIEVGGNMGIVRSISVRSTVIETFDKQQVIVPNGDFITGTVTNWTRGNQLGRAVITVGVAYGTDTRRVAAILREIAGAHPDVMTFPEPGVDFLGFGADSLDFRVRAVLYDVNTLLSVKSEMHHQIAERFKSEGIEIPFAQRDIWLRNPETLVQGSGSVPTGATPPAQRDPQSIEDSRSDAGDVSEVEET